MVLTAQVFVEVLKSKNLHYTVDDLDNGDTIVRVPFEKTISFRFESDNEHLALRTVFERIPDDKIADLLVVCNALNTEWRWFKFFIDGDKDLMIADDAVVSPETAGQEAFELLARVVNVMNEVKPTIMRAIYA